MPGVMRGIDGGGRRTVIHEGKPAGIAVGEHVHRTSFFPGADFFNDCLAMLTDFSAELCVFIRNALSFGFATALFSSGNLTADILSSMRSTAQAKFDAVGRVALSFSPLCVKS